MFCFIIYNWIMSLFHILNLHERKCACWRWLLLLNPYPGSDSYFAILRWRACTALRAGGPWGVCCSAPRATKRSCPKLKHVHADPPRQVASPSPSHLPLLAIAAPNYTCWQRDVPVFLSTMHCYIYVVVFVCILFWNQVRHLHPLHLDDPSCVALTTSCP